MSFKPYKGVSSNRAKVLPVCEAHCFKPYKGVSSNGFYKSAPIVPQNVSNPIREYLQISFIDSYTKASEAFQTL